MGGVAAPGGRPPLARLFAIGYRQLIDGLHDRLQARGWTDVRPAFGFALLAARDRPTSATELAELIGVAQVDRMRRDLMRVLSDPGDGQLPPVRPPW